MKIESEKLLEKKLNFEIKRLGGMSIKLVTLHLNGLPDRLCLLPGGRLFFSEIKTTKKKIRRLQEIIAGRLIKLGFKVYIIDSSDKIKKIISRYE